MGTARPHTPEKLVIATLLSEDELLDPLRAALEAGFGGLDFVSPPLPFDFTSYYAAEMGPALHRVFLTAAALVDPGGLAAYKARTNAIESRFAVGGRRRVNLDPGLLSLSRFILASTKDSSHRIPLGGGMYAEVTLVYERGQWRPLEWTYPDYASPGYREMLKSLRASYARQLRAGP